MLLSPPLICLFSSASSVPCSPSSLIPASSQHMALIPILSDALIACPSVSTETFFNIRSTSNSRDVKPRLWYPGQGKPLHVFTAQTVAKSVLTPKTRVTLCQFSCFRGCKLSLEESVSFLLSSFATKNDSTHRCSRVMEQT